MRQAFAQRLNAVIGWTLCPHLADRCCTEGMEIYTQIVIRAFLTGIINTLSLDKNEVQEVRFNPRKEINEGVIRNSRGVGGNNPTTTAIQWRKGTRCCKDKRTEGLNVRLFFFVWFSVCLVLSFLVLKNKN